jgi:hypothetical protein
MSNITFCVNHNLSEKFPKERLVMESQIFLIEGPIRLTDFILE